MKIYNSLTRRKEEFCALEAGRVKMYVCGPTVYDEPHIGHARSAYIFDIIRRYLEYRGYLVTFVRNVTDVDDKIIAKALKEFKGEDLKEAVQKVSAKYLDAYHQDMSRLGIRAPDVEPRATAYIEKMLIFIKTLIGRGAAYASGGDVYFNIKRAKNYGKLSGQHLENMDPGARISPGERKLDPLDFALWKSAKEGEPYWESEWGNGRPGWHIECSVMSSDILGDTFDIHGGGLDLIFPHHENEIAQSEGAGKAFARYWIHNGLLTIRSEKMAKSLGNYITIKAFLSTLKDADFMKLFFLAAHYRSPIDYTEEKIGEARKEKERFVILLDKIEKYAPVEAKSDAEVDVFRRKFEEAMDDDFNTPLALAHLFDLVTYTNKLVYTGESVSSDTMARARYAAATLKRLVGLFGLTLETKLPDAGVDEGMIQGLIAERTNARSRKDFKRSDEIRVRLGEMGVVLEDTREGTVWRVRG